MRRTITVLVLTITVLAIAAGIAIGRGERFAADLDGSREVPAVVTDTTGQVRVRFADDLSSAEFRLVVRDGVAVTQAHLHCGAPGSNGPISTFLFGFVEGGTDVDGELARGMLTDADVRETACGTDLADLLAALEAGSVYANVHTVATPSGEVRGDLHHD